MKKPYFGRLLTAMVTPFNADGSVNYAAGADFADWLLANGSDGLVVEGSTGEAATMDMDEKIKFMPLRPGRGYTGALLPKPESEPGPEW